MPAFYERLALKEALAAARFRGRRSHNYLVFRFFHPSLILSFNHDGLALDLCGPRHRVRDLHLTVEAAYGGMGEVRDRVVDVDLEVDPDGLPLLEPESYHERTLAALDEAAVFRARSIAIIGYSFYRKGDEHLDTLSLEWLRLHLKSFRGNVYVVDPWPEAVCGLLETGGSGRVFGIPAFWNVLAHTIILKLRGCDGGRSLNYLSQRILDRRGSGVAFPLEEYR